MEYERGFLYDDRFHTPKRNPKRVYPFETIRSTLDRIPFLEQFWVGEWSEDKTQYETYSTKRMNDYIGKPMMEYQGALTAQSMNKFLEKAERRGDI